MMAWIMARLSGIWPVVLALLAGLALAFGLRRSGERAGRRAAQAEQATRERDNARAQARAAARYRRDGAAERLRRGDF
ncbi:hypothetical protein [Aquibaculum sediminis]|uniref:hypothetical protein n=1 Tax=Aquibaculum sediminis TaxID=3231907 RepID=UPI003451E13D